MNSEEVTVLVESEIAGDWSRSNVHGVDLQACLVTPQQQEYEDSFQPEERMKLWLVLEEDPVNCSGYKIVFDEVAGMFGLAICGEQHGVFIGYYGTFLETLAGM